MPNPPLPRGLLAVVDALAALGQLLQDQKIKLTTIVESAEGQNRPSEAATIEEMQP